MLQNKVTTLNTFLTYDLNLEEELMVELMVKNLPASAGDVIVTDSILGSGRSPEEGMANLSHVLA